MTFTALRGPARKRAACCIQLEDRLPEGDEVRSCVDGGRLHFRRVLDREHLAADGELTRWPTLVEGPA